MRYEIIPIHRHDHARSTPTALTTILLGYFLLCGVETVTFITDSFCGGYLPTIAGIQGTQTLQQQKHTLNSKSSIRNERSKC